MRNPNVETVAVSTVRHDEAVKLGQSVCGFTAVAVAFLGGCSAGAVTPTEAGTPAGSAVTSAAMLATDLNVTEFAGLVGSEGVVVVDVRTPEEYATGHLANAINVNVNGVDFDDRIGALDRGASYAVYCRSGNRSRSALDRMLAAGFTDVHHLVGGIGAWQEAGLPVIRGS